MPNFQQGKVVMREVRTHRYVRGWIDLPGCAPHEPIPEKNDELGLYGCEMGLYDDLPRERAYNEWLAKKKAHKKRARSGKKKAKEGTFHWKPNYEGITSILSCRRVPDQSGRPVYRLKVLIGFNDSTDFTTEIEFDVRYRTMAEAISEQMMPLEPPDLGTGAIAERRRQLIGLMLSLLVRDVLTQMTKYVVNPDGTSKVPYSEVASVDTILPTTGEPTTGEENP